jgi:RNA polymerase primary sigma factor
LQNIALSKMRKALSKNEAQRSIEDINEEDRQRKRMEVIREFVESKAKKPAGKSGRN